MIRGYRFLNRTFAYCAVLLSLVTLLPHSSSAQRANQHKASFGEKSLVMLNDGPSTMEPWEEFINTKGARTLNAAAIDTTLGTRILAALNALYNSNQPWMQSGGVGVSVIVPGLPQWSGAVGKSTPTEPLTSNHLFEVGSTTKTFIGATILQLQEEGKLSVKDSLHKWLPSFPNVDSTITIDQLLSHHSGVYDYLNDDTSGTLLLDAYFEHPEKKWTPTEILNNYVGAPNFKPGKSYQYSNTGFLLLGLIIESVTKHPVEQEIRERFLTPLHLDHTFCGWADEIKDSFTHNWSGATETQPAEDLFGIDKTAQLTMAYAAGGIVSTPTDLARWSHMLYNGKLLQSSSMAQMLKMHTWPDGSSYGYATTTAPYGTRKLYGHTGGLPAFYTNMWTYPKDTVTVVTYVNYIYDGGKASANDYVVAVFNEIYRPPVPSTVKPELAKGVEVALYPNPVIDQATFSFALKQAGTCTLQVYDGLGRLVQSQTRESVPAGRAAMIFKRNGLPTGSYYYSLLTPEGTQTGRLLINR